VKLVLGAVIILLSAAASVRADDHQFEVSGGYAYLNDHTNTQSVPRGWNGGVAAAITSWLTIAGEVGGNYIPAVDPTANTTSIYSFLGGPRYVIRIHDRVMAFGQFLVGDVHASAGVYAAGTTTDDLAYQPVAAWTLRSRRVGPHGCRATTVRCTTRERPRH
jgi:hypothetical protein